MIPEAAAKSLHGGGAGPAGAPAGDSALGPAAWAAAGLALATVLAVLLSGGNPLLAAAPALCALVLCAALTAPLRSCILALFFLCLVADAPQDAPMSGHWRSPLYPLGQLLCDNLSKTLGIRGASFSGIDVLALLLLARVALRRSPSPLALPLRAWGALFFCALAGLAAWSVGNGADLDASYWQVRQIVWLPGLACLFACAIESKEDLLRLGRLVISAALIKAAVGLYFHFAIAVPRGISSPVILSHSETLLFCLSWALLCARFLEHPDRAGLRRCLWLLPPILCAVWLNNRRIAYVGLAATLTLVWGYTPRSLAKRAAVRLGLFALPLVAAYFVAGWSSPSPAFRPVAALRTIISPDRRAQDAGADTSTRAREIENYNLSRTLRAHPLGAGLGRGYDEAIKGPDISRNFALYRYVPHNQVLGTLMEGGPLGFFLFWSFLAIGVFLAARAHRFARSAEERCAALGAICAQGLYLIQSWGDMGTQSWSATFLFAAALAVAGRLALATSAWPAEKRREVAARSVGGSAHGPWAAAAGFSSTKYW